MPCICNVGGVKPLPFFIPTSDFLRTTGNGISTKNVLKRNPALGFKFSIQSFVYGATTVAKVSIFST